ncbi:hypothetical protein ACQ5SP_04180 [Rhodovulum sp. YNF3179]|uniref:hypothetical protein n=1 Tax=Rhodovulum sp. YNF3179 TaxID=3425127 RepID=UPI003D337857
MTGRLARLWRRRRGLAIAFVAAVALTLFFGMRMVIFAVYWSDPDHRDQAIAGWMTPRYVAHSWDVPPEVVGRALGLTPEPGRGRTIAEIAAARGQSVETLGTTLEAAIAAHRDGPGQ